MELSISDINKVKAIKAQLRKFGVGKPVLRMSTFPWAHTIDEVVEKCSFRLAFFLPYDPFSPEFDTTALVNPSSMYNTFKNAVSRFKLKFLPMFSIFSPYCTKTANTNVVAKFPILSREFNLGTVLKIAYMDNKHEPIGSIVSKYKDWILRLWHKDKLHIKWLPGLYSAMSSNNGNANLDKMAVSVDDSEMRLLETDEDYLWLANFVISQCQLHPWREDEFAHDNVAFYFYSAGPAEFYVNYKTAEFTSYQVFSDRAMPRPAFWDSNCNVEEILINEDLNQ